jgi:hypothetical protein
MIFADGEGGSSAGWVAAFLAIAGAIGSLVVTVMNAKHRNKQESDQSALGPLREALDRQQREIERREAHEKNLMDAFDQAYEEQMKVQVDLSELYGNYCLVYDHMKRLAATCKRLGEDPGELPPQCARPNRPDRRAQEFRANTLKQQSKSISESSLSIGVPKSQPGTNSDPK